MPWLFLFFVANSALATDQEGCLNCHQYRGLTRIDPNTRTISHFYVDPIYYNQGLGPHARLKCTDCHNRNEVEVFPHHKTTSVDCGKTCHLDSSGKLEVRFSHEKLKEMVASSVHGGEALNKSNAILGQPLRPEQARCLLCHDEPAFTNAPTKWAEEDAPIGRCNVCHDEQLPRNTQFSYWHVHARSQPARNQQDLVKVCGLCHSDSRIQKEFNLPDAAASYLASFHGKAVLLGSKDAAGCLDCHVSPLQNVHVMQKKDNPLASTNSTQIAATCRSPSCHPSAGTQISSAAIHLNLPTSRGVEFLIACVFVFLIVFTFGPSLALMTLKMFQIVVGRTDPDHEHHMHVAKQLMADPKGRLLLQRFTPHQRLQHWFLFFTFTTLCLTGFPIKFADRNWAAWIVNIYGGLPAARLAHRWAGALLVCGFFYHFAYVTYTILRSRKQTGKSLFKTVWELPMLVRPSDQKEMLDLILYVLFIRKKRPEFGRFNPEEKFEYIGVFWGTFVLGVTGILMWFNGWTSRHMAGRVLTVAMLLHSFEAFLALLHVGIVHLASVILAPGVFPVSKAMFTGDTPTEELVEAHGALLAETEKTIRHASTEVSHHA